MLTEPKLERPPVTHHPPRVAMPQVMAKPQSVQTRTTGGNYREPPTTAVATPAVPPGPGRGVKLARWAYLIATSALATFLFYVLAWLLISVWGAVEVAVAAAR